MDTWVLIRDMQNLLNFIIKNLDLNIHSLELVPKVGSKKKNPPTQFWKAKKAPTVLKI